MKIEAVTIGEATIVAIGASDHQDQRATLRNLLAVVLDVVGDIARHERAGWLEAQQFLDRLRNQFRILDDLTALVGMLGQRLAHPADQPVGRFVAGAGNETTNRRSAEHTSELHSLMRTSYAVFCLKKKKTIHTQHQ